MAIPIPKQVVGLLSAFLASSIIASKETVCDSQPNVTAPSFIQVQKIPAKMTVFTLTSHVDHEAIRHQSKTAACRPPSTSVLMKNRAASPKALRESYSFLHDVVGADGVLQISLQRAPERAAYSAERLESVGITPTAFPATDVECTPQDVLDEACNEFCSTFEAAIAHSHKRALEFAANRGDAWTAILEDDAIPVLVGQMTPGSWNDEFRRIWSELPANAKIVRLSWCTPNSEDWYLKWSNAVGDENSAEKMKLTQFAVENAKDEIWNSVGLCTSAYVVHKDIVPQLLQTFPCNCALDACLGWKFFNGVDSGGVPYSTYLYNLDLGGSADLTWSLEPGAMSWYGVMRQAHESLGSTVGERAQLMQKKKTQGWEPALLAVESSIKHELAALGASTRDNSSSAFIALVLNILVLAGFTYWGYKEHQKIKSENKEPKMGWKSLGCLATCLCCCGCGTPIGLCYPFDEPDDIDENNVEGESAS
jgi:hypothetical protein